MLEKIRVLMDQVACGDVTKLEAIDIEFENLVKNGSDSELAAGMKLLEDFLFAQGHISFEEDKKAA